MRKNNAKDDDEVRGVNLNDSSIKARPFHNVTHIFAFSVKRSSFLVVSIMKLVALNQIRSDKEGHNHHLSVTDKTMTSKCRQNVVDTEIEESGKISKMMLQNKQLPSDVVRQNVLSTNDFCEECNGNNSNVESSISTKRLYVCASNSCITTNTSEKKKVRNERKSRHRKLFFCRLNFVIFIVAIIFCQMSSFVSCQTSFDSDVNVERENEDNFEDDKLLSTNSRENGGHSFSSSPYPHQV